MSHGRDVQSDPTSLEFVAFQKIATLKDDLIHSTLFNPELYDIICKIQCKNNNFHIHTNKMQLASGEPSAFTLYIYTYIYHIYIYNTHNLHN